VVGHQEAGTERADHLNLVTDLEVAHVVGTHTAHRFAVVVFEHALDGQRQVVVARALAVAWAGDRVLTRMVRLAAGVRAGRNDADRLAFEHRKRHGAKVQHDVVGVVILAHFGHAQVAGHGGGDGFFSRLGSVEVGVGMGRRPGRDARAVLC